MGTRRVTSAQWDLLYKALYEGNSIHAASQRAGIHYNTALRRVSTLAKAGTPLTIGGRVRPKPTNWTKLNHHAKRGWDDFEYFRLHYLGHPSQPWALETAEKIQTALATNHREYLVMNVAPGVGKTTLVHDIAAWVTVRDRSIRGVFGSKNSTNAGRMMRRLRRTLERTTPAKARPEDIDAGLAYDAAGCLAVDYGLFRPTARTDGADAWNNTEFIVVQADDMPIEEKEPTWTRFGAGSDVLSMRYDLMLCDDMDDASTTRTWDAIETQRAKWDDELETRLETRGVLALIEQRVSPNDLCRYNLDKKMPTDISDDLTDEQIAELIENSPSMYEHIVYKAHDVTKCKGKETHRRDAPAWPKGCLLDPGRLPWRDIAKLRAGKPRTYTLQYQQEDIDPNTSLVRKPWIFGGQDIDPDTGVVFEAVGCVDDGMAGRPARGLCQLPPNLAGPLFSICTVDPSPTKLWSVQWWVAAPNAGNQVFLMDSIRATMFGNELLDFDPNSLSYSGVMESWQQRSIALGWPIQHWIVEINVANRFLLPYAWHHQWRAARGTTVVPHTTGLNKLDPNLGVDILRDWFRLGRMRLPYSGMAARAASDHLITEALRYPNGGTDDQVMGTWFLFANLPNLSYASIPDAIQTRPSWAPTLAAPRFRLESVS